ncbi:hypothetical protein F2Q68_00012471 [Brassica cretica]|uniref:Uncharacterized protein n=1 Tax=Brassica cretica TaxID=69181 RepID=A0A8S9KQN6_BRACR|nr:hypothetical protein F2Q68_00012471 [Brassica cretica]
MLTGLLEFSIVTGMLEFSIVTSCWSISVSQDLLSVTGCWGLALSRAVGVSLLFCILVVTGVSLMVL